MELEVGSILEGKVTSITKFGAFVALPGGKSGLVHISEIAYSYVSDVKDFLAEGQDVKVKVINIDERHRINLSIKQTEPSPARDNHRAAGRNYRTPQNRGTGAADRSGGSARQNASRGGRNRNYVTAPPVQAKGSPSFEDQLKKFMQESDSRQSDLNRGSERRGSRRGNGRNRSS